MFIKNTSGWIILSPVNEFNKYQNVFVDPLKCIKQMCFIIYNEFVIENEEMNSFLKKDPLKQAEFLNDNINGSCIPTKTNDLESCQYFYHSVSLCMWYQKVHIQR